MKICACNSFPYNINTRYSNVNFKQNKCYDTTEFFREDFDVDEIIYYLDEFYDDSDKINLVFYGCSNGKEPYSFLLRLRTLLNNKDKKFNSIIAKDIDNQNVLQGKIGKYKVTKREVEKLEQAGNIKLNRYIEIYDDGLEMFAFVRDSLKKDVLFKKADICDDIDNVPKARTVLFCRNFWNYLSSEQQSLLLNKLITLLDDTCHIIIGEFDKIYGLHELLEKRGFAQTTVKGVMRKTKPF